MICKHIFITYLNEPVNFILYTIKWFKAFLSNTNNSIYY